MAGPLLLLAVLALLFGLFTTLKWLIIIAVVLFIFGAVRAVFDRDSTL